MRRGRHVAGRTGEATLVLSALVNAFGSGMFLSGLTLFLVLYAELRPHQIGIGLAAGAVVGFVAAVPIARLADRYGTLRMLVLLSLARGVVVFGYLMVTNTATLIVAAALVAIPSRTVPPVTQAVVRQISDEASRIAMMARIRVVRNIGLAGGSGVAMMVIGGAGTVGFTGLLFGNAACSTLSALLLHRLARTTPQRPEVVSRRGLSAVRDRRYMLIAACNGVLALHVSALYVGLPLWAVLNTDMPRAAIPMLVMINAVLVVVFQIGLSRRVTDLTRAARFGTASGLLLCGAAATTAAAAVVHGPAIATTVLMVALVLLTLAEIWQSSSAWVISDELAPPGQRTEYIAAFSTGMALQQFVGPVLYASIVIPLGIVGWVWLAMVVAVVSAFYPRLVRAAHRRQRTVEKIHDHERVPS